MKKRNFQHNSNHDAYANQNLRQLVQGTSQGTSADKPGSEYTQSYPQLQADPNNQQFPKSDMRKHLDNK